MLPAISEKLLLVVQSKYLSKSTFITRGPVASLKRAYPNSVFSFADATAGITNGVVSTVNEKTLVAIVAPSIEQRLKQTEDRTTLDTAKFNHLCKLYVGLLREAYCLKDEELILLFNEFRADIDSETLNRIAFCCSALKWASSVTSGFDRVHFAMLDANEAARFEFKAPLLDKTRRRSEFRTYWESTDPDRVAAVDQERV